MRYIDLSTINEAHMQGMWRVQNRVVNGASEANLFSDVRIIEMEPGSYRSINGKERTGQWSVIREKEIIYNPQLKFFSEGVQVGNAIITRLLTERSGDGEVQKLTLYFNTGLELVLHKETTT